MRRFRCLHIVQLDLPCSRIWCIRVRLSPLRINDLDLGAISKPKYAGGATTESPYIVVTVFQVASEGEFPAD
jgi:hypothetical protein